MMLPKDFKKSISSLDETELEDFYVRFVRDNNSENVVEFARSLFAHQNVTSDELKRIQNQQKVDFSDSIDLWGEAEEALQKKVIKKPSKETYTILDSIDEGAMGEILIAKDNELGRTVAYKRIHPHVAEHPNFLKRFFMEAQITAQLQHPNIVPVYGLKTSDQEVGYAMKLIEGVTLKDLIVEAKEQLDEKNSTDKHHSLAALLDHFIKVCDAIHYAHRKGVVHRDLKPLNIMVGPFNEVYVMDWGIAKLVEVDKGTFEDKTKRVDSTGSRADGEKTTVGQMLGTPVYMSPEQASGANDILDHRSDIFSLGIILFELITLKRALAGKNRRETIKRASSATLHAPVPYSSSLLVPKKLIAVVEKATQLNPEDRYLTVEEFADDIRRYLHGEAAGARSGTIRHKIIRWLSRQ